MIHLRPFSLPFVLGPLVREPLATLQLWHRRAKARHELSRLDEAQFRDTGLDMATVHREAAKPFWQA